MKYLTSKNFLLFMWITSLIEMLSLIIFADKNLSEAFDIKTSVYFTGVLICDHIEESK